MPDIVSEKTIALAGILQAIHLIREFAKTGKLSENAFQTSIRSIFETHPKSTLAVFGETADIQSGLHQLVNMLNPLSDLSQANLRYLFSLTSLQDRINRLPTLLQTVSHRIQQMQKQVHYFSLTHPTVIANLADTYLSLVSKCPFRFFILGNKRILSVNENMEKIRALLLAAIRATVLWRQLGGSRIELILKRRQLKNSAIAMIKKIDKLNENGIRL